MDENRRLIRNTGLIALGNLGTRIVSFLLLPLYTSLLSPSEYGMIDYIVSISIFCVPFVSALMDESMFRFLIDCKTDAQQREVISLAAAAVGVGSVAFLALGIPVMRLLRFSYAPLLCMYILASVLMVMTGALLRGIGRTDHYAVFNFATGALNIALNVMFVAVLRWGVAGMLSACVVSQALLSALALMRIRIWKFVSFRGLDGAKLREMLRYSAPLIPNKISWSIINLSDRVMLKNMVGASASGLYAVSYKFPNMMDMVYGFFYQAWKESSARARDGEDEAGFYNYIYRSVRRLMFSLVLGMTAFLPMVYGALVAPAFHESMRYVPVLLYATYFSNMSGFYGGIFTAYMNTKVMGVTTVAAALINLAVNFAAIHRFGIWAAAASTLIANVAVYLYRRVKLKDYVALAENPWESAIAAAVSAGVLAAFYGGGVIAKAVACAVSVVYAAVNNYELLRALARARRGG